MWNASEFVLCVLHNTINSIATAVVIRMEIMMDLVQQKWLKKLSLVRIQRLLVFAKGGMMNFCYSAVKMSLSLDKWIKYSGAYLIIFVSHIFDCIVIFSLFGIWSKRLICTRNLAEYHFIMLQAIMKLYKIPSYANRWRRVTLWVSQNSSFSLYDWVIESLIQPIHSIATCSESRSATVLFGSVFRWSKNRQSN